MQETEVLLREGLSFDDVLLVPRDTDITPAEVDPRTALAAGITLRVPILSSPMDRVTDDWTFRPGYSGIILFFCCCSRPDSFLYIPV